MIRTHCAARTPSVPGFFMMCDYHFRNGTQFLTPISKFLSWNFSERSRNYCYNSDVFIYTQQALCVRKENFSLNEFSPASARFFLCFITGLSKDDLQHKGVPVLLGITITPLISQAFNYCRPNSIAPTFLCQKRLQLCLGSQGRINLTLPNISY